jgi:hypothetical protein
MTRIVATANATEADKPSVLMTVLVDLDLPGGHLYVHDGLGTLTFGGNDYLGVGQFGGIDGNVQDSLTVVARSVNLSLTGVDAAVLSSAMAGSYQGRSVVIYLGFIDPDSRAFVATPETLWEGRIDYMEVNLEQGSGSIKVSCEHRLRREPRIARYTDEDQQVAYPGDTFFHLLPFIAGFKSQWGDKTSQYSAESEMWGGAIRGLIRDTRWRS